MKSILSRILYWAPRVIAILFAVFISLFALDVFSEGYSFWQSVLALLIHLIPTYVIIIAILIAWRWELAGGFLFIALGVILVYLFGERESMWQYAWLASPLFLSGILFLISRRYRKR